MSTKIKIILSAAATLAVMIVIFIFSGQSGETSSGASNGVGELVLGLLGIEVPPGKSPSDVEIIFGFKIRNLAHIFLYTCLGAASYTFFASLCSAKFKMGAFNLGLAALCAFTFSLLYACTDEFHQSFIPGRSATVRDVLIDCIGIALSVLLITAARAVALLVRRAKAKNV